MHSSFPLRLLIRKTTEHACVPVHVCVSCPAACQSSAADWLQVQQWHGPGKFLTTVPKYLDVSQLTLTDDFLKVERYAFYSLRPLQRSLEKNSSESVRTLVEVQITLMVHSARQSSGCYYLTQFSSTSIIYIP